RWSIRPFLRYLVSAILLIVAAIVAISPFASTLVQQWSRQDIELRSTLVFNTVRDELGALLAENSVLRITSLFERLALDERLIAAGFCDAGGKLRYQSKLFPSGLSCEQFARSDTNSFSAFTTDGRDIVAGSFPIGTDAIRGHLVLLHDLSFAEERG